MRWQTTAVLAVILIALGAFYYVYEVRLGPEREKTEGRKGRVFAVEPADVAEVELKRSDSTVKLKGEGARRFRPRPPGRRSDAQAQGRQADRSDSRRQEPHRRVGVRARGGQACGLRGRRLGPARHDTAGRRVPRQDRAGVRPEGRDGTRDRYARRKDRTRARRRPVEADEAETAAGGQRYGARLPREAPYGARQGVRGGRAPFAGAVRARQAGSPRRLHQTRQGPRDEDPAGRARGRGEEGRLRHAPGRVDGPADPARDVPRRAEERRGPA